MSENRIRVIIKRPGEPYGHAFNIVNSLETLQHIVGGYIETVTLGSDWTIICNEEGRLRGLPFNCEVCGVMFVGPIIFAGIDGEEFSDFPLSFEDYKVAFGKEVSE